LIGRLADRTAEKVLKDQRACRGLDCAQNGEAAGAMRIRVIRDRALRQIHAVTCFCVLALGMALPGRASERIGYHEVRTDASGKIIPWFGDDPNQAYDHVVRQVWNFWITMRNGPNGVPYYLQHQVWKRDKDDPRGLGGDQINMALSSWNLLYGYLGDLAVRSNMRLIADYWMDHGLAPEDQLWGGLPYPYNLGMKSGNYDGDMRAGLGFLQPDKAASFGAELVMLYKATGERRYLDRAIRIADRLVRNVKPGDEADSPWPFRVNARTGEIPREQNDHDHLYYSACYTTNWTGALRLFGDLAALNEGQPAAYRRVAALVTHWLKVYPIRNNRWGPFFEDVSTKDYSDTEINADTLAFYILEHREWDPQWKSQARGILDWSYRTFANHEAEKWGVVVINEQTQFPVPGNSHTSRHASVELLYAEKTGDWKDKDAALRRLAWASYWVNFDGMNEYPRDDIWLTDGYGDFVRHYLRAMASDPELAPDAENHLLRTTSVIRSISYGQKEIRYEKFDALSDEMFKLGADSSVRATGALMAWDPATHVLRLHSRERSVVITFAP
jgi:hypothetical protein